MCFCGVRKFEGGASNLCTQQIAMVEPCEPTAIGPCLLGFSRLFNAAGDAAAGVLKDVDSAEHILHERRVGCPQRRSQVSLRANIAWQDRRLKSFKVSL